LANRIRVDASTGAVISATARMPWSLASFMVSNMYGSSLKDPLIKNNIHGHFYGKKSDADKKVRLVSEQDCHTLRVIYTARKFHNRCSTHSFCVGMLAFQLILALKAHQRADVYCTSCV
jgi:hypothetical protein